MRAHVEHGRLFDAVSSCWGPATRSPTRRRPLLSSRPWPVAHMNEPMPDYHFQVTGDEIDPGLLRAIVDDIRRGCAPGPVAAGFHAAVASLVAETADRLGRSSGIERVALSGGVFPERPTRPLGPRSARAARYAGPDPPLGASQRRRLGAGAGCCCCVSLPIPAWPGGTAVSKTNEPSQALIRAQSFTGSRRRGPTACTDDICITCSDEGRVAEVTGRPRRRASRGIGSTAGPRWSISASWTQGLATSCWSTLAWLSPRLARSLHRRPGRGSSE